MTEPAAIELRGVNKRFGTVSVLKDIDLEVARGEFCVFVGPSGCGKSTLLRLVAGLDDVTSGTIAMEGRCVEALPPSERDVAMVFQSYALYPHMSVHENMAFGLRHRKLPEAEIERRLRAASDMLQLGPLLARKPRELSGGQRQRVAIGRALVREPRVFLFDEPLSNLDAALRVHTRVEIARLHRALGTVAMVYVTHDQVEAMTLADRIVLLRPQADAQGAPSIAQVGTPLELYHRPASRFVAGFIGSPAMNFLPATALASAGDGLSLRIAGQAWVAEVDAAALAANETVSAGIRPEHVQIGSGPLRAKVAHVERLGEHGYVYLAIAGIDGPPLLAKIGDEAVAVGDELSLRLPPQHLHVFRADGRALPRRAHA